MEEKEIKLSLSDWLAIERTRLANERTFLAYFRTALALLAGSVTILRLDAFKDIRWLGYTLLMWVPLVLLVGVWRLVSVKREIERRYKYGKDQIEMDHKRNEG
jgi:putative membrane protein